VKSNGTTNRINIRTKWWLFVKWEHKHHINKKGIQRQTTVFQTQTQHKTEIRQSCKQQTTNKSLICNSIQANTKATNKTQHANNHKQRTSNCANWQFKQNHRTNNDTNEVVVVCKLKMQTSYQTKGKHWQTTVFHQNTTQDRHTAAITITSNKQITYM